MEVDYWERVGAWLSQRESSYQALKAGARFERGTGFFHPRGPCFRDVLLLGPLKRAAGTDTDADELDMASGEYAGCRIGQWFFVEDKLLARQFRRMLDTVGKNDHFRITGGTLEFPVGILEK